jgi:hypothetical protein
MRKMKANVQLGPKSEMLALWRNTASGSRFR